MNIYSHFVYWIHFPDHTNIDSEGYVGVSNNLKRRISEHLTETKKQISEKLKNRQFSEETRAKISAAKKEYWKAKRFRDV